MTNVEVKDIDATDQGDTRFINFFFNHKVEKGLENNYTSLACPTGSIYVPVDQTNYFFELYTQSIINKKNNVKGYENVSGHHITEKHRHICPILIDLDFRFNKSAETIIRRYSKEDLYEIVGHYFDILKDYVYVPDGCRFFIMEKTQPVVIENIVKDGIHIVCPDIVTKPSVQFVIRLKFMELLGDIINRIEPTNEIEHIVDESVIYMNNWFLYGSHKKDMEPYLITHILEYRQKDNHLEIVPNNYELLDLVKLLSIRNKNEENQLKPDKIKEIEDFESKVKYAKKSNATQKAIVMNNQKNKRVHVYQNIDMIKKLVSILKAERADDYTDWIRVGWCLRNIDNRLVDSWVEFSKKSRKFKDNGECHDVWDKMREGGLGVGTLHMWAKQDNPEGYQEIMKTDLRVLIHYSLSGTHVDLAKVIHHLYQYEFVCSSIKNRLWWEFRNHRWHSSDSGVSLRKKISDDVWKEYHKSIAEYSSSALVSTDQNDQTKINEMVHKISLLTLKLKTTSFKENLMKECMEMFYVESFEEKLDSNKHLLGFENGVYDLQTMEFRDGRPEDYISFSTLIDYIPYNPTDPTIIEIKNYFSQVLTKECVREYMLKLLGSILSGVNKDQKFYICTGSGSNSKSLMIELFERTLGDYTCKLPITLLTQKRAASNAAQSELARTKGKRFACLQEPSEDEKLNVGLMKEMSGSDKLMARALYKEPVEFVPQFKMMLLCNHLPNVPSDDGGTWRRIRVIEFTSKFVEDPTKDNEFPINLDLPKRMEEWNEHFMALLIEYYKKYIRDGMTEPEEVMNCTNEYRAKNDFYSQFSMDNIERADNMFLSLDELYNEYREWLKSEGIPIKLPSKPEVVAYFDKNLCKSTITNHVKGYKNYRLKTRLTVNEIDLIDA